MVEISWDQIGQAQWEQLADRARAPMQQRWAYGETHAALGGSVLRALICQNDRPVAICQSVSRRVAGLLSTSLTTRGPLWLAPCDRRRVLKLIRRTSPLPRPRAHLFTLPDATPRSTRLIPLMSPATSTQLALPVTMKSLQGKWRNALRQAKNSGLRTRHTPCSAKMLSRLLLTDARQQLDRSYRALPAGFTRKWHQIVADDLRLITVGKSEDTIATALFIRHGNTATYHIAHNTDTGRLLSAGRLALWRAFTDFTKQGIAEIDLGIIDTENAPGLARFKLGTGAIAQRLGPTVLAI